MKYITDAASAPQVAVPLTSGIALSNILSVLPDVVNCLTAIYLIVLITMKGIELYQKYKERNGKD